MSQERHIADGESQFVVLNDNPRWHDSLLRAFGPYSDSVIAQGQTQTYDLHIMNDIPTMERNTP